MADDGDLKQLYTAVREAHLQPLWIDSSSYIPAQPHPRLVPAHWTAATVFPLLHEVGRKLSPEFADRRVLVCNNPALPPFSGTTQTLYACLQLLLPGERTSEHRHSQSAFRFVLSGEGAATILNGREFPMRRGDLIVTPPWTWHGHVNDSGNQVIWLDAVDNAIVKLFDATFFESSRETQQPEVRSGESFALDDSTDTPYWHYEWVTMKRRLDGHCQSGTAHPSHGYRLRYLDPTTGGDPLPTMAAFLSYFPGDFSGERYRSSDSVVCVVVSGSGCTRLESTSIDWSENDVFVLPTWEAYSHQVSADAILFSFSDQGAQERLGCWREQPGG